MARVEPCYWSEGCHIYAGVSLQERRATMKVMLGVSLWARWDATLVLLNITLYKRTDYVIIPIFKPIVFRPWNFCCLRFCVLPFRHFGSIYRRYDRSCRRSGCRRSDVSLAINRNSSYRRLGYSRFDEALVHSTEHSRGDSVFAIVFRVFFAHKNC